MNDTYFIKRAKSIKGPIDSDIILQAYNLNKLNGKDLISSSNEGPWETLDDFFNLDTILSPTDVKSELDSASKSAKNFSEQANINNSLNLSDDYAALPKSAGKASSRLSDKDIFQAKNETSNDNISFFKSAVDSAKRIVNVAITEANRSIDESEQIKLKEKLTFGRSTTNCDWVIPHPSVSKRHFQIVLDDSLAKIQDLASESGTFVNGIRIEAKKLTVLNEGDQIMAGPYVYQLVNLTLRTISKGRHAHLLCYNLTKEVVDHQSSGVIRILNNVTLDFQPGKFVILLGPSGSGKSTLLKALSGQSLATSGSVLFNEQDLYTNYNVLKKSMAIVPQKDILHTQLSLRNCLRYTSDLRLSSDITRNEKINLINDAIAQVEMKDHADLRIREYSGGQIKRASLANELISNPSLLFIDEATSGLDELSDKEIMSLLRNLSDNGKTIICITHNLGNVEQYAHQIVVMAKGGNLAFMGTPNEALTYFSISGLNQLYLRLKDKEGAEWAKLFLQSKYNDKISKAIKRRTNADQRMVIQREKVSFLQKVGVFASHAYTTGLRNISLQLNDKRSLLVAIAQPLLVAFLLILLFGNVNVHQKDLGLFQFSKRVEDSIKVLFLLGVSTFWFGCNNAAKEIVKEREIFERERNAGLDALGYLFSKFFLLGAFTATQSMVLYFLVAFVISLQGSMFEYNLCLISIGLCGVGLGLAISAFAPDTDVASTSVPLAVIPQVILAGGIKIVTGMSQVVSMLFAPSYWCFGMMTIAFNNTFTRPIIDYDNCMYSQKSMLLDLTVVFMFFLVFMSCAILKLCRFKVQEFAKKVELENWLKSKGYI